MDNDYTVKVISIAHVVEVGDNLKMHRVTRVRIQVGNFGQFVRDFPEGQDDAEAINLWKTQTMLKVQAIGG